MHIVCGIKLARHHLRTPLLQPGGIFTVFPGMKITNEPQSWYQEPHIL